MSEEELEPLPSSLKDLFVQERARTGAPPEAKARELARLSKLMTPPPGGGGPPAPWGKMLAMFGAGSVLGGLLVHALSAPRVVQVERVVEVPVSVTAPEPVGDMPPEPVDASADAPPRAPSPANAADTLGAERAILDIARTALGRGDGPHALEATDRHARQFPSGKLSEEREAMAIQALVKSGRRNEAEDRATRFRKRYPNSVLGVVVDAAIHAMP